MFQPRKLRVTYSVEKPDGEVVEFAIRLDEHGFLEGLPADGPAWTHMKTERCANCTVAGVACRAALAIVPVVEAFSDIDSLQQVRARACLPNYTAEVEAPVSHVASSIMGLSMAASGCPKMAPFRGMAIFHQPFATIEETVVRAAGFMLLGHWAHGTLADEDPYAPLIDAWQRPEEVNMHISRSLRDHCASDAALNGLVNLDMFAKAGAFGLKSALAALRPALLAWDLGLQPPGDKRGVVEQEAMAQVDGGC